MTAKPGIRQMWIGTAINCVVGVVQVLTFDYPVVQAIVVAGAVLGVYGATLASRGNFEVGRRLIFASAIVFIPVGVIAALGAQRLRDDWERSNAVHGRA